MLEAGRVVLDDVDVLRERKPAYEGRHGQHREGGTEKKSQRERWRRSSQAARARQTLVRSPSSQLLHKKEYDDGICNIFWNLEIGTSGVRCERRTEGILIS